jgi:4'-phosphopantetheinyl transferase
MIEWLIQSTANHPDLVCGVAPVGLLNEREQAQLAALRTNKRRRDWLLGRWTAKHLVQSYVEGQTGLRPPLAALLVDNDANGAPFASMRALRYALAPMPYNRMPVSLSISHCNGDAFCTLTDAPDVRVGADIERIEQRSPQFAEDYFTAHELDQVRAAQPASRDIIVTLIWSAKEAALKALRLGLTVDTRSISCSFGASAQTCDWAEVVFTCDQRLLGVLAAPVLMGWWQRIDDFVLTIAAMRDEQHVSKSVNQRIALSC